jgi:glycosyltransferase involved in cell wall biosynthesis
MIEQVTPLIITYNEADNIRRTLDGLLWARRIVVIDSGSSDGTLDIARSYSRVEVFHRPFEGFAQQCNFGLEQVYTEWALSLDADYELSDRFVSEIHGLAPDAKIGGYRARFVYRIHGRPLRASLYPPRTVLYRKSQAHYRNEGHGHRVVVTGSILPLSGYIFHDDRKPLNRWLSSQVRYAAIEAEHLLTSPRSSLPKRDLIRLAAWPAPVLVFLYMLTIKRCLLDGWHGWYYALQRCLAELMIALEIIDRRLMRKAKQH